MSRFDRVSKLAMACFSNKFGNDAEFLIADYSTWGYISVIADNDDSGDGVTDISYNSKDRTARVVTYDPNHLEENGFVELCRSIGVEARVEYTNVHPEREWDEVYGIIPDSPLGFARNNFQNFVYSNQASREFRKKNDLDLL